LLTKQGGLLLAFVFGIFLLFILTIYWSIFHSNLNAFLVELFGTTINVWVIWFVTDLLKKKAV
jgi:hypothetical protein